MGCFQFGAFTRKAAMNVYGGVLSGHSFHFFGINSQEGSGGSRGD